jgi:hypothetical protein
MERNSTLVLPSSIHGQLRSHLFPGDGMEAAALLLCARVGSRRLKLLVKDVIAVPHAACRRRTPDSISWPGEFVEMAIDRAETEGLSIMAVHSHPGGGFWFSETDDASDRLLMPALFSGTGETCGSAVMVPEGAIRARLYGQICKPTNVDLAMIPGNDISLWWAEDTRANGPAMKPMAFTSGMTSWLNRLSACVIGVSGTGSIVVEQLARLGFGEIILVDFDKIELRNLNRILNSKLEDAEAGTLKVDMFARAVQKYRTNCEIIQIPHSVNARDVVLAACEADVLFSCVDTAEGRHIADRLSAYFTLPLLDVGVSIPTRRNKLGENEIVEVCGRIDYVFPGGSTLQDRDVYNAASLEAEYLAKADPNAHNRKVADGYLPGIGEQAPAVITLNMRGSSACVMEWIARTFPFRHFSNADRARTVFMLADGDEDYFPEQHFPRMAQFPVAAGMQEPLLGLPVLGKERRAE